MTSFFDCEKDPNFRKNYLADDQKTEEQHKKGCQPEDPPTEEAVKEQPSVSADESSSVEPEEPKDVPVKEEVEEPVIPVPPVDPPLYGLNDGVACFGFSQCGQSHVKREAPCQDRCYSAYLSEKKTTVTAIADGVGSCALSDLGAATAVRAVVDCVFRRLNEASYDTLDGALAGKILREAFRFAYDEVVRVSEKFEQLLFSLQSTLTVAVYDGKTLFFGHAGDDGIVALTDNGTLAMVTTRHKGEEASSVFPLQSTATWQFGMVPNVAAFVMATDGVLDAFVGSEYEENRVYYPFVEPIFDASYRSAKDVEHCCRNMFNYLQSDEYRAKVTDDLTMVAVVNSQKAPFCLPAFDVEVWNEQSRIYEKKRNEVLYGKHHSQSREKQNRLPRGERKSPTEEVTLGSAEEYPMADEPEKVPISETPPEPVTSPSPDTGRSPSKNPYSKSKFAYGNVNGRGRTTHAPSVTASQNSLDTSVPQRPNTQKKRARKVNKRKWIIALLTLMVFVGAGCFTILGVVALKFLWMFVTWLF